MDLCRRSVRVALGRDRLGITEHYAHADPGDALTVTMLVYLLQFVECSDIKTMFAPIPLSNQTLIEK
ncbi:hypothetical protein FQN60_002107, partial [Etheostoma spectabile]